MKKQKKVPKGYVIPLNASGIFIFILYGVLFFFLGIGFTTNETMDSYRPNFLKVAEEVSNEREYTKDYNCVEFSERLVERYAEIGLEAKVVSGWASSGSYCKVNDTVVNLSTGSIIDTPCAGAHAWVEVTIPIDAVTGKLIK